MRSSSAWGELQEVAGVDDLIQLRISVLRQSLQAVVKVPTDIGESRAPTTLALEAPADEELGMLIRALRKRSNDLRAVATTVEDTAPEAFRQITELADALWKDVDGIRHRLDALVTRRNEIRPRMIDVPELDTGLQSGSLVTDAKEQLKALDRIADKVAAGQVDQAWDDLTTATEAADRIFREYVDLLNGVAIREVGFDRGLCRIADRFVKELDVDRDAPWAAWTVPSQQEARERTLARIVRIGFPDWSIWAVPLAAHPFAHIALGGDRFVALASQWDLPDLGTLLADTFAATVAGPAYASALFTLRLRPRHGDAGALDMQRAYVTLRAIEQLEADNDDVDASTIRTALAEAWTGAVTQIGAPTAPPDAVIALLDELVDTMRARLASGKFPMGLWPDVIQWSTALAKGEGGTIRPRQFETDEVRIALNAVWLARLRTQDPDMSALADAGRRLTERILDPSLDQQNTDAALGGTGEASSAVDKGTVQGIQKG
jgi:hypothetical protein